MKGCFRWLTAATNRLQPSPLLPSLLQSASLCVTLVDLTDERLVESSAAFCQLLGYSATELTQQTATDLNFWAIELNELQQRLKQQPNYRYEAQLRHKSGELIDVELSVELLRLKRCSYLLMVGTDMRQRKQSEAQLAASLQEKQVLLKEVHHRVRNSLHLIGNLLDLQAGTVSDRQLSALFATTQNRIQAMTLIHEQLYQSENLSQIDFSEYLNRLMLNVFLANSRDLNSVQPLIESEPVLLNLETAVPCGLLVNELLVNSLQHAFPEGGGKIQVQLRQANQKVEIQVRDDGVGMAEGFDWQNAASLGFRLVRILAKQLKASIQVDGTAGTAVTLSFAELNYHPRF